MLAGTGSLESKEPGRQTGHQRVSEKYFPREEFPQLFKSGYCWVFMDRRISRSLDFYEPRIFRLISLSRQFGAYISEGIFQIPLY